MAYSHAERNLALIRQLEAETRHMLGSLARLEPEQSAWLLEAAGRGGPAAAPGAAIVVAASASVCHGVHPVARPGAGPM